MSEYLHIDWTACDGRGLCAELLERLDRDPWGYPLTPSGSNLFLTAAERPEAREAVALCPRQALSLRTSKPLD